jgi:hypothetical protein
MAIIFLPFGFLTFEKRILQLICQIELPLFVAGVLQLQELQKVYEYFGLGCEGEFMMIGLQDNYNRIDTERL